MEKPSSPITRIFRVIRIVLHMFNGMLIATLLLPRLSARQRDRVISRWAHGLMQVMNIRVVVKGSPPHPDIASAMLVGNHVSWVDIHALNSVRTVRFIAKSEVRDWPVFGWFARKVNTFFIDRQRKQDTSRMVAEAVSSLQAGDCLCYFPEGTTTDGTELKPFKGSLMQAAIDADSMVWPVTIRYPREDGSANTEMAYWGDITLMQSIAKVLACRKPVVELDFAPPISPAGHDRRSLTLQARQAIASRLDLAG